MEIGLGHKWTAAVDVLHLLRSNVLPLREEEEVEGERESRKREWREGEVRGQRRWKN